MIKGKEIRERQREEVYAAPARPGVGAYGSRLRDGTALCLRGNYLVCRLAFLSVVRVHYGLLQGFTNLARLSGICAGSGDVSPRALNYFEVFITIYHTEEVHVEPLLC